MLRECSPPQHVTCHVSCVTCHVSHVICHMSHVMCHFFSSSFSDKVVKLVQGLLSTRPTLSSLLHIYICADQNNNCILS